MNSMRAHITKMAAFTAIIAPFVCRDVTFAALAEGEQAFSLAVAQDLLPSLIFDVSVDAPQCGAFLDHPLISQTVIRLLICLNCLHWFDGCESHTCHSRETSSMRRSCPCLDTSRQSAGEFIVYRFRIRPVDCTLLI